MKKRVVKSQVWLISGSGAIFLTLLSLFLQNSGGFRQEIPANDLVAEHLSQQQLSITDDQVVNADGLIAVGAVFAHNGYIPAAEYRLRLAATALGDGKAALLLAEIYYRGGNPGPAGAWAEKAWRMAHGPQQPQIRAKAKHLQEIIRTEHGQKKNN